MNAIINFTQNLVRGLTSKTASHDVFKFNGGVHPPDHKAESTQHPIASLAMPENLVLPLRQHVGNIPKIKVQLGDHVLKGQLLAEAEGSVSAAIHAPTSGLISAISEEVIPHPSGLPDLCITLTPDGKDTWIALHPQNWRAAPKKDLVASLRLSGIVGLGGATFPTHIKLRADGKSGVHTLVINAAECEPYITCDDMLMRERAVEVIQGIAIAQHLLGAEQCIIGIEDNKPEAAAAMREACLLNMTVKVVPTLYPSGDARRLVHLLLGTEIPHDKRSTEVGIQVFNVATVMALYRYFEFGEPSLSRIVTMTGNVVKPQNFEVLFGTPLQDLINAAGGAKSDTTHFIMGGPMMGFNLQNSAVPITKAANCIIAAAPQLFAPLPPAMPCIRCARCADACPVNLQPQELYWFSKSDNFEKARDYDLFDCIECGCCSYVCPSDIPLVQYYRYAKSEIIAADKAKEAADVARERNEFRLARIDREKLERAQKHAERAQAAKASPSALSPNSETKAETTSPTGTTDKQAAIAAAIERAKALKLAAQAASAVGNTSAVSITSPPAPSIEPSAVEAAATNKTSTNAAADKQALIAAAIERAKAMKLAAAQAGVAPKNTENVSKTVQAEINKIDAMRDIAKQKATQESEPSSTPDTEASELTADLITTKSTAKQDQTPG